jgi:predicted secreted protein
VVVAVVIAAVGFTVLWLVLFLGVALVDEDVNHWNWPSDGGPGALVTARMAILTGLIAASVVGGLWWVLNEG